MRRCVGDQAYLADGGDDEGSGGFQYRRAGFYSYDRLDNGGTPSSERILPEYQNIKTGDKIPTGPGGGCMIVKEIIPNKSLLFVFPNGMTWSWGLYPENENLTRLVSRLRFQYVWKFPAIIFCFVFDAFEILMMRKCLLEIKRRAESESGKLWFQRERILGNER